MDGADFGVGVGGEESEELMLALDWIRLGATFAVPTGPDAGEKGEWAFLIERKPGRRLERLGVGIFAK